jgi:hypothetical protein
VEPVSKVVYKYPLHLGTGSDDVEMPVHATIVHVGQQKTISHGVQSSTFMLWAEHLDTRDLGAEPSMVVRRFKIFGTGMSIPDGATYLHTVMDDPYVWHIYEVTP